MRKTLPLSQAVKLVMQSHQVNYSRASRIIPKSMRKKMQGHRGRGQRFFVYSEDVLALLQTEAATLEAKTQQIKKVASIINEQ